MTIIDQLVEKAYGSQGKPEDASRVYEALIKASLFVPCKKMTEEEKVTAQEAGEPFIPLYTEHNNQYFLLTFDTKTKLDEWAGEMRNEIDQFEILGGNLIKALGNQVHLCLNFGSKHYKEFPPEEIKKLKSILQDN